MKLPHSEFILNDEDWMLLRLDKWMARLKESVYRDECSISVEIYPVKNELDMKFALERPYQKMPVGSIWGECGAYAWFRFLGKIPQEWKGHAVDALIDLEGEVSLFDEHGGIYRRLTWGSAFGVPCQVEDIHLSDCCAGGEPVAIYGQAWASSIVGVDRPQDPERNDPQVKGFHKASIRRAQLRIKCPDVLALFRDVEILLGLARECDPLSARRAKLVKALFDACMAWQDDPSRSMLVRDQLRPEWARPATSSSLQAVVIGHAHIDTGWLWRIHDSVGKCARTFASQAELLDKYPSYRFGSSSAAHYEFIKNEHPDLHQRIQKFVTQGRWEVLGGMWVEPDTNLPSGESMIRQILYAQKFFRKEFNVESEVAWLPDVFGLSAALPQILLKSGIKYMVTKKPHWGRVNRYPNTTMRWAGHDGSEIILHVLPQARDYNGLMRPQDLIAAEKGFSEKDRFDDFIYSMGIGDGGGGPSEVHIERALRMASLEGLPRVTFGNMAEVFYHFENHKDLLKKHRGEMYVEGHRGTYTTQAGLKQTNRTLEIQLTQMEQLFSCFSLEQYPRDTFQKLWQALLIQQFHDILPGSSIREVIEDAEKSYAEMRHTLATLKNNFASRLQSNQDSVVIFNSLNHRWSGVQSVGTALQYEGDQSAVLHQQEPDGQVINVLQLAGLQMTTLRKIKATHFTETLELPILENEHIKCIFGEHGSILSLVDKKLGRELLSANTSSHHLRLYVDRPIDWDAWDIDAMYRSEQCDSAKSTETWTGWTGDARSVIIFKLKIGNSSIMQKCSLAANSSQIDFETTVQWNERHKMLRVGFTGDVQNAVVRCEIQHGYVERPTHKNTSFEEARFEVVCHRYATLLDETGGLAILNNSKYGIHIEEDSLELALLRSTTFPDHCADIGEHHFTYALRPLFSKSEADMIPAEAANLNVLPMIFDGKCAENLAHPVQISGDEVSVEAVKLSEAGDGMILRLAELRGKNARLQLADSEKWVLTDMMERPLDKGSLTSTLNLRPFEVLTLFKKFS